MADRLPAREQVEERRVWIAVEDRATQVVLERVLRRVGFGVERVAEAGQLLGRLAKECPDLLIVDRAALEVSLADLRARPARREAVPALVAVSGAWDLRDLARLHSLGVEAVHQPIRAQEFLKTVDRILAARPRCPVPPDVPDVAICGFGQHAETLSHELTQAGYRVQVTGEGGSAVRLMAPGHFRVLLLDLQVPVLREVVGAIEKLPACPLILAVGRLGWREADCLRPVQVVTFLEKPVQFPLLLCALEAALEARVGAGERTP